MNDGWNPTVSTLLLGVCWKITSLEQYSQTAGNQRRWYGNDLVLSCRMTLFTASHRPGPGNVDLQRYRPSPEELITLEKTAVVDSVTSVKASFMLSENLLSPKDKNIGLMPDDSPLESINKQIMRVNNGSHIGVNDVGSELVGNLKAPEDPTREEASPNLYAKGECKAL
ncbi:hypothetical protein L1987_03439 [Smallanthus sonchifolius]|uniref:Uncharacterized protein n=1 Tax=Smallanthus sonchifolius TaxID=185202 RepID=A0ACB9KAL9_9ASTR|nr:hypothetical protein L1987_03439 [Smallanthus sonchifolius]